MAAEEPGSRLDRALSSVLRHSDPFASALAHRALEECERRGVKKQEKTLRKSLARVLDPSTVEAVVDAWREGHGELPPLPEETFNEDEDAVGGFGSKWGDGLGWLPPKDEGEGMSQLGSDVASIGEHLRCNEDELEARTRLQFLVESVVHSVYPLATIERYGSGSGSGVGDVSLFSSDVDLCVSPSYPLRPLADALGRTGWALDVEHIHARVPIVSFSHSDTGISVDISTGGTGGVGGSDDEDDVQRSQGGASEPYDISSAFAQNPKLVYLAPLVRVLKVFLEREGLADVYSGGIGSYRLYVMVLGAIGSFQAIHSDGTRGDHGDLEVALVTFLRRYAKCPFQVPLVVPVRGKEGSDSNTTAVADFDSLRDSGEVRAAFQGLLHEVEHGEERRFRPHRRLPALIWNGEHERLRALSATRCKAWVGAQQKVGTVAEAKRVDQRGTVASGDSTTGSASDSEWGDWSFWTAARNPPAKSRLDELIGEGGARDDRPHSGEPPGSKKKARYAPCAISTSPTNSPTAATTTSVIFM